MLRVFNAKQLVAVTTSDKEQHEYYRYKPATNFILWTEPECFTALGMTFTKEDILKDDKNLIIVDNVVYHKPSVALRFSDKSRHVSFFDTFEEAKTYGAKMAKDNIVLRDQIHLND